jgi:hypothetical protein
MSEGHRHDWESATVAWTGDDVNGWQRNVLNPTESEPRLQVRLTQLRLLFYPSTLATPYLAGAILLSITLRSITAKAKHSRINPFEDSRRLQYLVPVQVRAHRRQ